MRSEPNRLSLATSAGLLQPRVSSKADRGSPPRGLCQCAQYRGAAIGAFGRAAPRPTPRATRRLLRLALKMRAASFGARYELRK